MNAAVLIFFFHNVLATFLLGGRFLTQQSYLLRLFGLGLILDGIAFLIWAVAIINKVQQGLDIYVMAGAFFFLLSLLIFFLATINPRRKELYVFGGAIFALIAVSRLFLIPSSPAIVQGFFFFNPHPFMEMIHILLIMLTAVPAIEIVAREIPLTVFKNLFRYGFLIELGAGIVLLVSSASQIGIQSLYLTGFLAGLTYFVLWITFLFHPKALSAEKNSPSSDNHPQSGVNQQDNSRESEK